MSDHGEPKALTLHYPTNAGEMEPDKDGGLGEWVHIDQVKALFANHAKEAVSELERVTSRLCACRDCGGQGEIYSGHSTSQGHNQPPEPDMDVCGTCGGDGVLGPIEDFEALAAERDQLKAEVEKLASRDSLHVQQFNGLSDFRKRTVEGFDRKVEALEAERDQLKAENDRLRTGMKGNYDLDAWLDWTKEKGLLKEEVEESDAVIEQLSRVLARVAVALKGEELPLHRHSYHDLVEGVTVLKLENDLRKDENEGLRDALVAVRESIGREFWDQYAGLDETRDILDAAIGKGDQS